MKTGFMELIEVVKIIIMGALSIGGAILGWLVKVQREENREMSNQIAHTREQITQVQINYVHKNDLKDFKQEFFERLEGFKTDIKEYIRSK